MYSVERKVGYSSEETDDRHWQGFERPLQPEVDSLEMECLGFCHTQEVGCWKETNHFVAYLKTKMSVIDF